MAVAEQWDEPEHWRRIAALVREYARRKYGDDAEGLTIHLARPRPGRQPHYEPFPPAWMDGPAALDANVEQRP